MARARRALAGPRPTAQLSPEPQTQPSEGCCALCGLTVNTGTAALSYPEPPRPVDLAFATQLHSAPPGRDPARAVAPSVMLPGLASTSAPGAQVPVMQQHQRPQISPGFAATAALASADGGAQGEASDDVSEASSVDDDVSSDLAAYMFTSDGMQFLADIMGELEEGTTQVWADV
jgi:hypothetical protein